MKLYLLLNKYLNNSYKKCIVIIVSKCELKITVFYVTIKLEKYTFRLLQEIKINRYMIIPALHRHKPYRYDNNPVLLILLKAKINLSSIHFWSKTKLVRVKENA